MTPDFIMSIITTGIMLGTILFTSGKLAGKLNAKVEAIEHRLDRLETLILKKVRL